MENCKNCIYFNPYKIKNVLLKRNWCTQHNKKIDKPAKTKCVSFCKIVIKE